MLPTSFFAVWPVFQEFLCSRDLMMMSAASKFLRTKCIDDSSNFFVDWDIVEPICLSICPQIESYVPQIVARTQRSHRPYKLRFGSRRNMKDNYMRVFITSDRKWVRCKIKIGTERRSSDFRFEPSLFDPNWKIHPMSIGIHWCYSIVCDKCYLDRVDWKLKVLLYSVASKTIWNVHTIRLHAETFKELNDERIYQLVDDPGFQARTESLKDLGVRIRNMDRRIFDSLVVERHWFR